MEMRSRLLTLAVLAVLSISLLYPARTVLVKGDTTLRSACVHEEYTAIDGDLEGPDYLQPPKHYKTLKRILEEVRVRGPPPVAVSGTRELLVILVELSDATPDASHTTAHFWDRFFDTTPPSVRDFYLENSYGSFTYVPGNVLGWYPSTYSRANWENDPRSAVTEAIQDADADFNFAPYDVDLDGTVTNDELTIFIIVSGDVGGAFHWWTSSVSCDGVNVEGEFSATHEWRHIGSYCHELGHDLGLPDLYDTDPWDGATVTGTSEGIGNYGLMGGGSWTFSHMTAWSKIQLGWITPTIITSNGYYTILDAETHAEAYILRDPAHSTTEYFLIENRYPPNSIYETIGSPVAPSGTYPDSGIVIYHIDETRMQDWITSGINNVNRDETHKGVDVECADAPTSHVINADDLDSGANRGDVNDLWDNTEYDFHDTSAPCNANWYDGTPSGMDVRALPAPGPAMTVALSIEDVWPPEADANGPYSGTEGTPVTFNGGNSFDLNGFITTFEWDLDGDGVYDDATGKTPSHTWFDDYSGTIGLKVTDDEGLDDTDSTTVSIENVAPTVDAGPDQTVNEGDTVSFSGSFIDPGTLDTHTIEWDFGDSSPAVTGTLSPTHIYGDNDVYTVTLTVTDDDGGMGTDTLTVTVANVAPTATIDSMTQPNPQFILPIVHTLTFTASFTDPGWLDTHTAAWDFGDGAVVPGTLTEENVEPDATGTATADHIYSEPGTYTVTLTITDDDGGFGTAAWDVTVLSAEEAKDDINEYIQSLPNNAFKNNPTQMKKALDNMFSAIDDMLANEEYKGAIQDLRHNIRGKADGSVDGNPKNDWIVDPVAQKEICKKIDDLIAYLKTFP